MTTAKADRQLVSERSAREQERPVGRVAREPDGSMFDAHRRDSLRDCRADGVVGRP